MREVPTSARLVVSFRMTAYDRLIAALKRVHVLHTVHGLLGWDEQVNLPPDSVDQRADQLALMAELHHAAAADPALGAALAELEAATAELSEDQCAVVREARRDYDRVVRLPADFVAEKARLSSAAYHAWAKARPANDFAGFAPYLEKHLDLARREAALLGWGDRPYDYAIDQHDPGFDAATIDVLFAELKSGLVPLVQRITASAGKGDRQRLKGFPVDRQAQFAREVTEQLGFNYGRGRMDVSLHPFCEGSGADIRMTTRFSPDDPLNSLFGAIHETGHGLYEQGLPREHHGTALGQNLGMGMHESQSRMWENQVGRSAAFWQYFEGRYRAMFAEQLAAVSAEELYRAVNAVQPTFIRVDADELHYNLHIILRFELEKRLLAGDLAVADLPAAWNDLSEELLGARPPDDRQGVLQDVHWSGGAFGYFPSYCLGNMIAAQLWATVRREQPGLDEDFARGDFSRLLAWLQQKIHHSGRRVPTLELVEQVTGAPLSPRPLLAYLEERYGAIYR